MSHILLYYSTQTLTALDLQWKQRYRQEKTDKNNTYRYVSWLMIMTAVNYPIRSYKLFPQKLSVIELYNFSLLLTSDPSTEYKIRQYQFVN
jgi:hypothetical protein